MANPIQLLIELQSNRAKGNANIDAHVKELRKRYDSNPLLVSVGINKSRLDKEIQELNKSLNNRKIELDVSLKNNSNSGFSNIEKQINSIINKVKELNGRLNSLGNGSGQGSNSVGRNLSSDLGRAVAEIEKLKNSNRQATSDVKRLQQEVNRLTAGLNGASNGTRDLQRNTGALGNAFQQAFTKFPIWILAANAFYAPIRGLQDLTKKVIELDTAIVGLARVSNLNDFQLDRVLEKSIENVDTLSAKTSEYLELVNEFARTGKDDTESLALANTATILQNISDLNASQTFDALTAAQISFNIEAEKSIEIADKLNEVNLICLLVW